MDTAVNLQVHHLRNREATPHQTIRHPRAHSALPKARLLNNNRALTVLLLNRNHQRKADSTLHQRKADSALRPLKAHREASLTLLLELLFLPVAPEAEALPAPEEKCTNHGTPLEFSSLPGL